MRPSGLRLASAPWLTAALLGLLSACGGGDPKPQATPDSRSTLAIGPCGVPIADPTAVCGTLTVPEDRSDKNSRLIGLPFVVIPATARAAADTPTVIFTGGPGPSSLRVLESLTADDLKQYPLRASRDVIVMTQRGADLTTPQSLDCSELTLDFAGGQRFADEAQITAATQACRQRLVAAGVKLQTYTTATIARDMEELRLLLGARRGFKQWNVVGSSYGSRLAQAYVRDFPAAVRSVVYDGPSPLQERDFYYAGALDGLGNLISACEAQADCAAAYPQLKTRFASAVLMLQATPQNVRGVPVRGVDVVNALRATLANSQPRYDNLPMFMDRVARGDLARADELVPFVDNLILTTIPEGLFYTVTCTDDAGLSTPSSTDLPLTGKGWPDAVRLLMAREGLGLQARACPIWTQGQTLSAAGQLPLRSDAPSLITVGQFDASTPTTSADLLLSGLSQARKLVFTGRGHGLLEGEPCMLQVVAAFVDDPLRAPDSSCIDAPQSLRFVTAQTQAATQSALTSELQALKTVQPEIRSMQAHVVSARAGLVWSGALGEVDPSSGSPVTAQTPFRIASVTKTFTSAAIHRLAELDQLRLQDSVSKHLLPATTALLRERGYDTDKITVLHLAAHTSGLPDHDSPAYQQAVLQDPARRWSRRDQLLFGLDRFNKVGAPGETFSYSDTGYILLGEIIEQRTGQPLGAAFRRLLRLDELGLKNTWMEAFDPAPAGLPPIAHAFGDNGLDLFTNVNATVDTWGGGGLVSTVEDLARFYRALLQGQVVSAASLASMRTDFSSPGFDVGLGRGLFRFPIAGDDCWGHTGFWGVGVCHSLSTGLTVAVTLNFSVFNTEPPFNSNFDPMALAAKLAQSTLR